MSDGDKKIITIYQQGKENLLREAGKMADKCSRFLAEWKRKNPGNAGPPRDMEFILLSAELHGFLKGLFFSGIIDEGEMKEITQRALIHIDDPSFPSSIMTFIEGIDAIDTLSERR